jgi:hypothetical protein
MTGTVAETASVRVPRCFLIIHVFWEATVAASQNKGLVLGVSA